MDINGLKIYWNVLAHLRRTHVYDFQFCDSTFRAAKLPAGGYVLHLLEDGGPTYIGKARTLYTLLDGVFFVQKRGAYEYRTG